jgi:hypothetical protein
MSKQDIQAEENRKKQRPANCGHQNQRPCAFTEFFPSCDSGLQEAKGLCLTPQAAAPKPKERPGHCGRVDQPACRFLEFFPSCESGLKKVNGRCQSLQTGNNGAPNPSSTINAPVGNPDGVGSTLCGGPNQRPCLSSDENPETIAVPTTATSSCGGRGQRACCLGEVDVNATVSGPNVADIPSSLNLKLSTTRRCSEKLIEVPGCSGDCTCNGGGIANSMCTVIESITEPDTGWKSAGLPSQSARGYADLHLHLFGHMAHGGKVLVGKPYDTDCGSVTLPAGWEYRSLAQRVIGKDTPDQPACGKSQGVNKALGDRNDYLKVHGGHGLDRRRHGGCGHIQLRRAGFQ